MLRRNVAFIFVCAVKVPPYLGFPWILSYDSSLFNGLCWINGRKIFLRLPPLASRDRATVIEEQDCSSGKFSLISDLQQAIVVGALS
jgi:hypothetical protein